MIESSSRRRFLRVVATGSATVGAVCLGIGCGTGAPAGKIAAGNVSDLDVPSLKAVANQALAVGRDAAGVYAMTLICTHDSCDMETDGTVSVSGVTCTCHGSRFTANGAVVQGPARTPLEHFLVAIDAAGAITVDADSSVDAATRVKV